MIVLGLDTSTTATAAGLLMSDGTTLERRDDPAGGAHPGHATRLLAMIDELLGEAGLRADAVTRIAVGCGPGTFTGLRVGIATARGLARSLDAELVAVSSLRALAHGARGERLPRPLLATIDARRGEVFVAAYAPDGEELIAPCALAPEGVAAVLASAHLDGQAPLAVGDGAVRYRDALAAAGAEVPSDGSPLHLLRASAVCALGLDAAPVGRAGLLPDYLRRPDAELALEGAGGGGRS